MAQQAGRRNPQIQRILRESRTTALFIFRILYCEQWAGLISTTLRAGKISVMEILLKRAYEAPDSADGFRVLVDRLWPRGKKKADLRLDVWAKDISPSTELRKWFGHDPKHWREFCRRYRAELKAPAVKEAILQIVRDGHKHSTITLIYGARDTEHNEAAVLQPLFKRAAAKIARA